MPRSTPADRRPGSLFVYTSGTTGRPKGIRRPIPPGDPDLLANANALFGRAFDFRPFDGPMLVSTGMFHGGSHSYYMGGLNVGHALVIMDRFEPERTLQLIEQYRVRTAYMVPTQFHRLLQLPPEVRERYDHSSLHSVVHSAAPCPRRGQGADDGVVGPGHLGDLRRHGGRGDDRQAAPLAREAGDRRSVDSRRAAVDPRRRRQRGAGRHGRPDLHGERRRVQLSRRPGRDRPRPSGQAVHASAISATSTTTATCSSTAAPRT